MKYRLGLDLGTNSIGWAIAEITDDDGLQLADAGVRIFTDGREPASGDRIGDPLAVQRRKARAARRQRDRRKRRQKLVMSELVRSGLLPHSREARKAWLHHAADGEFSIEPRRLARSVMERIFKILGRPLFLKRTDTELFDQRNPYYLRTKALDERLAPFELGRVLMHLSLHRGFKSNRKTDRTDDEASNTYDRIRTLRTRLGETGSRTLGEFLWKRYVAGDPVRFRPGRTDFYPDRAMYQDEFETIRSSQQAYHPNVNWDRLRELMYYQRPLRPVERGKCRYYPEEVRGYADLPSVARFRILQEVSNLAFVDSDGSLVGLSNEEKDRLAHELYSAASKSFDGIRKLIGTSAKFNLEDGKRAKLGGDEISFQMMKTEHAGDTWEELSLEQKDAVVEALHRADDNAELIEELRVLLPGLSDQQYEAICGVRVKTRTASVSARFARECGRVMERDHVGYDQATNRLGLSHYDSGEAGERESLPYYGEVLRNSVVGADPSVRLDPSAGIREYEKRYGKITNVTVHIALNQLRKLVNALIVRYGKPHEIVVELGRELKLSQRKISEIVSEQ
ncbi:MAG: type II CRISPR RNA-guided endonuclease Cas9, partial [Spirochaetales bacterium]